MVARRGFPWELFEALSNARGVTGDEAPVRRILKDYLRPHVDRLEVDSMGSLLVEKRGRRDGVRLLLGAHMDEVGFMVVRIEKSGMLRLQKVGGLDDRLLSGKRVRVGEKAIQGVLGAKPPHLAKGEEASRTVMLDDMVADIGAADDKEAKKHVKVGDTVTFDATFESWAGGLVRGKAFDDRAGCALLAALVASASPVSFVAAFTTQEEIGMRGGRVAAQRFQPAVAVALEGTAAADTPSKRGEALGAYPLLGGGPVLTRRDGATISDRTVFGVFERAAVAAGVKWQEKRPGIGGTDAGEYHRAGGGARSISVSVPCRYIHAPSALAARADIEATLELVRAALPGLAALKRPAGPRGEKS
ncbi:MAG: M42 family peptidase [Candidatus Eisenbacteria bacterium]|nr:M42 family peptidase [Candidatus Eisenbacteria bacterium]